MKAFSELLSRNQSKQNGFLNLTLFIPLLLLILLMLPGFSFAAELNLAPDCSGAHPSQATLWPPNHEMVPIEVLGVSDPDGDAVSIAIQCILQDEELNTTGDGNTEYDGGGIDTSTALVRAERSGNQNWRFYHIDYIATDSRGARCGGEVLVSANHDKKTPAIDEGRLYQSTPSSNICGLHDINNPPIIYSEPVTFGQSWEVYHYDVDGHDPDQDILTYSLTLGPDGPTIDSSTGLITWNEPIPGEYQLTVSADDGRGATAEQSYTLFINGPPIITSSPGSEVIAGEVYTYQVTAEDPNNDTLHYAISSGPEGMTIDPDSGLITWTPTLEQVGSHQVSMMVNDGRGGETNQEWVITVINPNEPPEILNTPPPYAGIGELYQYQVQAVDPDKDTLTFSLLRAPEGMAIDPITGVISWTPFAEQLGKQYLTIKVEDGKGGEGVQPEKITVVMPSPIDLEPIRLNLDNTTVDPQTLELTGTAELEIRNNGEGYFAGGYRVILFEDSNSNQTYDQNDHILASRDVSGEHNGGDTRTIAVELDAHVSFVDNLIYAFADSLLKVEESIESNNIIHSKSGCEHKPEVGEFNPVLEWAWTKTAVLPNSLNVLSNPVIIDINQDNIPDLIFQTTSSTAGGLYEIGILRALSGDTGQELFTITDPQYRLNIAASIAAGDIDNDGKPEIVACDSTIRRLIAFENDGTFKWRSDYLEWTYWGSVSLHDIDQDGIPEILFGRQVLNNDGSLRWKGQGGKGSPPYYSYDFGGNSFAVDLDLDGVPEILAGNTVYRNDGSIFWKAPYTDGFSASANFDNDPYPEIILITNGRAILLEHTGELAWGPIVLPATSGGGGPPTIADYDNDGEVEIGVAGAGRYIVLDTGGSILWTSPTQDKSSQRTGSSVFDFEGDGSAEVIYRDEKYLRVYKGSTGEILFQTPMSSCTWIEYPYVVDIDNDNNAEIVTVANNNCFGGKQRGVYVFGDANDTWVNTRKIWNQHAYSITNVNDDGTIPRVVANNWDTFNNFRQNQMLNPFGCQDLSASYLRADQGAYPESITLTARVGNSGVLAIGSGTKVSFYHSDPLAGGTLIGTTTIEQRLEPGQYLDLSVPWNSPPREQCEIYVRADDDGTGTGKIREVDEDNNSAHFTIIPGNHAPIADAGEDRVVFNNTTLTLDSTASHDPDQDPLTHHWKIISKPAGSETVLSDPSSPTPSITVDRFGAYLIQLTVNDGIQNSGVAFVTITSSPIITVPDLSGLLLDDARAALLVAELQPGTISHAYNATMPIGHVFAQTPVAGTQTVINTGVDLMVSKGIHMVTVPELTGLPLDEAQSVLAENSLATGPVVEEYIDIQPAGHIFAQDPQAGLEVPADTGITLHLSLGPWNGPDDTPPSVTVFAEPQRVEVGDEVTLTVWAADNVGVVERHLLVDGLELTIVDNKALYTATAPGRPEVVFTARDSAGLSASASTTFTVIDQGDTTPPLVSLADTVCGDVTTIHPITGTISDENLVDYILAYREQGLEHWSLFGRVSTKQLSGELGTFDPTLLKNGVYELALYAEDISGNGALATGCVLVDGKLKLGHVELPGGTDVSIPRNGFPLSVERIYDNRSASGDFGPGWNLPSSEVKAQPTLSLGGGWDEDVGGGRLPVYYLMEKHRHVLAVRLPGDQLFKFKMDVNPKQSILYPIRNTATLSATWIPDDANTQASIKALDASGYPLMLIGNDLRQYGVELYNPTRFEITLKEGTKYIVSTTKGLESMTDVYGHTISYDENSITHSEGGSITFERGEGNRIEWITDIFGRKIEYIYGADGMLEKVIRHGDDPVAIGMAYNYTGLDDKITLKEIKAPDGTVLGSFEYTDGRVTALIDAEGNRIIYGYDIPNNRQEITDQLGNVTLYEYDAKGNVTKKVDPLGNTTQWSFDALGNKLSETDPLGNTTSFSYDGSNNMLTETDPLGNTTAYTYDGGNRVLSVTDPLGNVTSSSYDGFGKLTGTVDPLGNNTSYDYDFTGNIGALTDAMGNVTRYTHNLVTGEMTSETDPLGNTTVYTYDDYGNQLTSTVQRTSDDGVISLTTTNYYDALDRVIRTVDPDGLESRTEYSALNQKSADIAPNGARTEFFYDWRGNLIETLFADGTSQMSSYDAMGNRLSSTDREGHTTSFIYDANKQLTATRYPDGVVSENMYDPAGRLSRVINERGFATEYQYDEAGRRTEVIDALGNTTSFYYDENSRQISMTDALGHSTSFEYDLAGRQVKTVFSDGTFSQTVYDELGRKITAIDQNGTSTGYEYDPLGRLTGVVDALGNTTTYRYDDLGNKTTQIDAEGRVTRWSYDNRGNQLSRTLPLGQSEYFTYDESNNRVSHTDFNGETTTFSYSVCCGRLLEKHFADGSTETYTYTGNGQIDTVVNQLGTTAYSYDSRGRTLRVDHPDGTYIGYTYDEAGNRTKVDIPSSITSYTFDELNRLATVIDPDGGITTYGYDAVGNRASVLLPNQVLTRYTYDELNRLTVLENLTPDNSVLSSFAYTLGNAGNRLAVLENSGRRVQYTYDPLYRLIVEDIIATDLSTTTIVYQYDNVGNRLSKMVNGEVTSYSYDDNDRLLSEGANSYQYDANGNTIAKSGREGTIYYTYDGQNRLIRVETPTDSAQYGYNHENIRVSKTKNGVQTRYLIDANQAYQQVLEEYENNQLSALYIYGDDLISQDRGNTSYYLYDGQMSTRQLVDPSATITDRYDYDAFGVSLFEEGLTENNYRYTGEQFDGAAQAYYLRARYYDQGVGRFFTTDPWMGQEGEVKTLHKYNYSANDPINFLDYSGLASAAVIGTHIHQDIHRFYQNDFNGNILLPWAIPTSILIPDIADITLQDAYEIKPFSIYGIAGFGQLSNYINVLNRVGSTQMFRWLGNQWKEGAWTPEFGPYVEPVTEEEYIVLGNKDGVIFYWLPKYKKIRKKVWDKIKDACNVFDPKTQDYLRINNLGARLDLIVTNEVVERAVNLTATAIFAYSVYKIMPIAYPPSALAL